jgi:hypothetical protein
VCAPRDSGVNGRDELIERLFPPRGGLEKQFGRCRTDRRDGDVVGVTDKGAQGSGGVLACCGDITDLGAGAGPLGQHPGPVDRVCIVRLFG